MSTIYKRIRSRREELGLSQDDLAKRMGYKSRSSINKIEMGTNDIPQSKIVAFANALNTTPAYLMGWTDDAEASRSVENIPSIYPIEKRRIPLLGNVSCGEPTFAEEDAEIFVEANSSIDADFCLKAKGDSMTGARIFDGDIVFIRKQSMVNNGEIAVVLIGDETTLKRVQYDRESNEIALFAENPAYKTMRYKGTELDTVRILGKAIAFQSYLV